MGDQPYETGDTAQLRTAGYRQAHLEAGREVDEGLVIGCSRFHRRDGAAAMEALLALPDPPTAVFCYNDLLALGAMRVLLSRGLRVPDDVALIGFDDIEDGRFATPSLSTVAPAKQQIASLAVERLVARLGNGTEDEPTELWADHHIEARESTLGR
jgi:DNA-binding LacI/PurR family transcriptional regulator